MTTGPLPRIRTDAGLGPEASRRLAPRSRKFPVRSALSDASATMQRAGGPRRVDPTLTRRLMEGDPALDRPESSPKRHGMTMWHGWRAARSCRPSQVGRARQARVRPWSRPLPAGGRHEPVEHGQRIQRAGAPSGWYCTVSIGSSRWRRPSTDRSLRFTWLTRKPDRSGTDSPTTWTSWFWAVT